jgi:hypothetical protein
MKRRTPVRRVNAARKAKELLRAYGPSERRAWIASLPCLVARCPFMLRRENAHVITGGTGRRADAKWIVPLCPFHHAELHRWGHLSFCVYYFIPSLSAEARTIDRRWQAHVVQTTEGN